MDGLTEIISVLLKVFRNLMGGMDKDYEERPAELPDAELTEAAPVDQTMPDESVFAGLTSEEEEPGEDIERPAEEPQAEVEEPSTEEEDQSPPIDEDIERPVEAPPGDDAVEPATTASEEPAEIPVSEPSLPEPVMRKVLAVIYDPLVPSARGHKLSDVMGGHDPEELIKAFISDIKEISAGYANYVVTEKIHANHLPVLSDGFQYSPDGLLLCWQNRNGFHQPDLADYGKIIEEFKIAERVNAGEFDEVWLFGPPYAGFYESRMVGAGAFYLNSAPHRMPKALERRFVIMGFNYERGVGEMLESFGHRAEDTMKQVYRKLSGAANLWERFTRHQRSAPGMAEVGTIHFAPNSERDYDWGNLKPVLSRCENWLKFPDLSADARMVECSLWGGGDMRAHHRWWFQRLPHVTGKANGIDCNWWKYIIDPNEVK